MSAASKSTDKKALTPLELEIMQVLWSRGDGTATEVMEALKGELAYNTVGTMLQVLLRKGKVKRVAEGRAYRYRPTVTHERAAGSDIGDLIKRMFGGSAEAMLLAMVDSGQVDADDLARARRALPAAEKEAGKTAAAKEARG